MPTEAEIAAAQSPAENGAREGAMRQRTTFRERTMQRLSGGTPRDAGGRESPAEAAARRREESRQRPDADQEPEGNLGDPIEPDAQLDADGFGDEIDPTSAEAPVAGDDEAGEPVGDDYELTPKTLAEAAGLSVKQLYAMQLTTGDGDTFTLGELKDRMADLTRVESLRGEIQQEAVETAQSFARSVQELDDTVGSVRAQAEFYANLAEQGVKQFEGIDWAQLRTDPERYEATRKRYEAALTNRDKLAASLNKVVEQSQSATAEARKKQAEVSKRVLARIIPSWSREVYADIADFAVEKLHYTPEEVDQIVDWRRIRDIHAQMEAYVAAGSVEQVRTRSRKTGPGPRRKSTGQVRNAQGQFAKAREAAFQRPGDRGSFREMKARQLEAERGRRRR